MRMQRETWVVACALTLCLGYVGVQHGSSCSVLQGARQIDEMTDAQYTSYTNRTAAWAAVAAQALLEEEVVSAEELVRIATVIRAVSDTAPGVGSVGVLAAALEADGWKQAALLAIMGELDAQLDGAGFWSVFGERQQGVLAAIADALEVEVPQ